MPNDEKPAAQEAEANIALTEAVEANENGPRHNVHSEADEPVEQDAPPPLPN